jgi:hypothetical protein
MSRVTRATRLVRRVVDGETLGALVVELDAHTLTVRYPRARGPLYRLTWRELTYSVLMARERPPRRGRRSRR